MKKKIILGIVVAMIAVGIGWLMLSSEEEQEESNVDFIQEASEETGFIGEKIVGNPSEAKVVIYEYADFGCSHCADWNRRINDLMDKHEGEQRRVQRLLRRFRGILRGIRIYFSRIRRSGFMRKMTDYWLFFLDFLSRPLMALEIWKNLLRI